MRCGVNAFNCDQLGLPDKAKEANALIREYAKSVVNPHAVSLRMGLWPLKGVGSLAVLRLVWPSVVVRCLIPDDCIDYKRYPLFMARSVMRELIKRLKTKPPGVRLP